jgi:regulator of PEP synthase PpsR (kinase-PPPase family)
MSTRRRRPAARANNGEKPAPAIQPSTLLTGVERSGLHPGKLGEIFLRGGTDFRPGSPEADLSPLSAEFTVVPKRVPKREFRPAMAESFHLHLVSDATGETINSVARACLVQFEDVEAEEHIWTLVRTERQLTRVLAGIAEMPGLVLFTMVNEKLRRRLQEECRKLEISCIPVLDPVIGALAAFLGREAKGMPGRQHEMDAEYFGRIDAMGFALAHDDGQSSADYNEADVILVGVSRTSKTPTCIYLANRGIKAANFPVVPGVSLPADLLRTKRPLIVGLTKDPAQLVQVRRNRLRMISQDENTDYVDLELVRAEVLTCRRLCTQNNWPVIDVSRRSIEETAASIIQMLERHRMGRSAVADD